LESLKERNHFVDLGVDRRIILRWILDLRVTIWEGVDWVHLAQDRDQLQAAVNTVMNPLVL
jgi:hypothetical protein